MAGSTITGQNVCKEGLIGLLTALTYTAKHDYFDAYISYHQNQCQRDFLNRLKTARSFFESRLFANILAAFTDVSVKEYLRRLDREAAEVYSSYVASDGLCREYHTKWQELVFTDP